MNLKKFTFENLTFQWFSPHAQFFVIIYPLEEKKNNSEKIREKI